MLPRKVMPSKCLTLGIFMDPECSSYLYDTSKHMAYIHTNTHIHKHKLKNKYQAKYVLNTQTISMHL